MKFIVAFIVSLVTAGSAFAYSEFIGYGYNTCLTCHVNGHGSGPLNDYGRALWSAEIASRAFYPKSMSDEDIANQSGFLGSVQLPSWFKPHLKYRDLSFKQNLGTPNQTNRYIRMQQDLGFTSQDPDGKYTAVITWGNFRTPRDDKDRYLAREYYVRLEMAKNWWLYAGLMEKVFGIRNINHFSYQRSNLGFNQTLNTSQGYANNLGLVIHRVEESWELAVNPFTGNPYEDTDYRQKGFSGQGEFDVGENKRLGGSVMVAESKVSKKDAYSLHYRQAVGKGSAVIFEYGWITDKNLLLTTGETNRGTYNLIQASALLTRGYSLRTEIERYNRDFKATEPDNWRYSLGLLAFPLPRLELRGDFVLQRSFSNGPVFPDLWYFQGLMHVSL